MLERGSLLLGLSLWAVELIKANKTASLLDFIENSRETPIISPEDLGEIYITLAQQGRMEEIEFLHTKTPYKLFGTHPGIVERVLIILTEKLDLKKPFLEAFRDRLNISNNISKEIWQILEIIILAKNGNYKVVRKKLLPLQVRDKI
ncbi:hypothetical protein J4403_01345 [Candidatus Woesearchaeota archaeon]|nr:hypothetical protein [Candidatus Woesearchaeota archaeon]